jgi:hypothetical protein
MEIIPAKVWGREVTGNPSRLRPALITELTVHYTGAPSVNVAKNEVAAYIKRTERGHKARPNDDLSTIGYNFLIDEYARIWEGRGWEIRNGANGTKSNDTSISVCILVGVKDNKLSAEVIDAVRELRAMASKKFKRELVVRGHRDHKATSCPGEDVYKLVKNGTFLKAAGDTAATPLPTPVAPKPEPCEITTLRRGDSGPCVKNAQQQLIRHGFKPGPADGDFGAKTEAAVKKFQKARGLTVDGIVGKAQTWPALLGPVAK